MPEKYYPIYDNLSEVSQVLTGLVVVSEFSPCYCRASLKSHFILSFNFIGEHPWTSYTKSLDCNWCCCHFRPATAPQKSRALLKIQVWK